VSVVEFNDVTLETPEFGVGTYVTTWCEGGLEEVCTDGALLATTAHTITG
jgi:hypothetical protein